MFSDDLLSVWNIVDKRTFLSGMTDFMTRMTSYLKKREVIVCVNIVLDKMKHFLEQLLDMSNLWLCYKV